MKRLTDGYRRRLIPHDHSLYWRGALPSRMREGVAGGEKFNVSENLRHNKTYTSDLFSSLVHSTRILPRPKDLVAFFVFCLACSMLPTAPVEHSSKSEIW